MHTSFTQESFQKRQPVVEDPFEVLEDCILVTEDNVPSRRFTGQRKKQKSNTPNFIDLTIDSVPKHPPTLHREKYFGSFFVHASKFDLSCNWTYCPYCRAFDPLNKLIPESLSEKIEKFITCSAKKKTFVICALELEQANALFESYWAEQCFEEAFYNPSLDLCFVTLRNPVAAPQFWEAVSLTTNLKFKVFSWKRSGNSTSALISSFRKIGYIPKTSFKKNPRLSYISFDSISQIKLNEFQLPPHQHPSGLCPNKIYGLTYPDKVEDDQFLNLTKVKTKIPNSPNIDGFIPSLALTHDEIWQLIDAYLQDDYSSWSHLVMHYKTDLPWEQLSKILEPFCYDALEMYKLSSSLSDTLNIESFFPDISSEEVIEVRSRIVPQPKLAEPDVIYLENPPPTRANINLKRKTTTIRFVSNALKSQFPIPKLSLERPSPFCPNPSSLFSPFRFTRMACPYNSINMNQEQKSDEDFLSDLCKSYDNLDLGLDLGTIKKFVLRESKGKKEVLQKDKSAADKFLSSIC